MTANHPFRHVVSGVLLFLACVLSLRAAEEEVPGRDINPISRIARVFSTQLVDIEDKIAILEGQLSTCSERYEQPLKVGLGYRGCRNAPGAEDPSISLDLGCEMPVDAIVLIPAQREFLEDSGIFPLRFTLETSNSADFAQRTLVFTSGATPYVPPDGVPATFEAKQQARYVRLTVQKGQNKGALDLFGLAEFVVISKGDPVSFGASVKTVGNFDAPGVWYPEALTDGRTPLGIWQNGYKPKMEPGDSVPVTHPDETTTWTIQLDAAVPLDRVVLFPYQVSRPIEGSVFPESLVLKLAQDDAAVGETVFEWKNPLPGESQPTPMVIALHGKPAKTIQVTALLPSVLGEQKIHALSEIEIWSHGRNLALGRPVGRMHGDQALTVTTLTDGYCSRKKILPVPVWLHQLEERARIERELVPLRSIQRQLAANCELNTTWAASMFVGLLVLIPVFIIERRRLITKDHLDQIRKRISADLHDDIGSNLGSISLIARTARKDLLRLNGPKEIETDLYEVEIIARESSLAMRDIVWLLERQQDSIGDLVQRMREIAGRLLREIDFTLDCESIRTGTKLSLNAKRHLFLFFKESIHNIIKHSQATRVSIRLWDEDDKLALEIFDNGVGIPLTAEARPATVNKLEDRAHILAGLLEINSSKETGTRIRLLVKRSHLSTRSAPL